jgi:dienelactone hydrolase
MDALEDFTSFRFGHDGRERTVYRKGQGPAVIVMHEMPGITPEVARFGRRVADAGFTVFMPSLFGKPGAKGSSLAFLKAFAQVCVSREWKLLSENKASPVVDWLRALGRHAHQQIGGRGIGAIGMCITGNFALTMALDPEMMAPVLSQPSLPVTGFGDKEARLHASPEALAEIRRRHAADGLRVIGLRFEGDKLCRKERFDALEAALGPAFDQVELRDDSARTRPASPHSVLTKELIDEAGQPTHEALEQVLAFFAERLR